MSMRCKAEGELADLAAAAIDWLLLEDPIEAIGQYGISPYAQCCVVVPRSGSDDRVEIAVQTSGTGKAGAVVSGRCH